MPATPSGNTVVKAKRSFMNGRSTIHRKILIQPLLKNQNFSSTESTQLKAIVVGVRRKMKLTAKMSKQKRQRNDH